MNKSAYIFDRIILPKILKIIDKRFVKAPLVATQMSTLQHVIGSDKMKWK